MVGKRSGKGVRRSTRSRASGLRSKSGGVPSAKRRTTGSFKAARGSSSRLSPVRRRTTVSRSSARLEAVVSGDEVGVLSSRSPQELDKVRDENRLLKQLHQIISFLGSSASVEELLPEIVDLGIQLTELSRGVLATESQSGDPGPYTVKLIRGWLAQDRRSVNFELVQHLLQKVLTDGEPYFNTDLQRERSTRRLGARMTLTTAVVLPLRFQKRVIGALALVHDEEREPFVAGEKELLVSYAEHAALALARLKGLVSGSRFEAVSAELVADDVREDLVKLRRELRRYKNKWQKTLRGPLREARDRFTREYLKAALRRFDGDLNAVAEEAGVQRKELIKLLHAYQLIAKPSSSSQHKVPRAS